MLWSVSMIADFEIVAAGTQVESVVRSLMPKADVCDVLVEFEYSIKSWREEIDTDQGIYESECSEVDHVSPLVMLVGEVQLDQKAVSVLWPIVMPMALDHAASLL
jgi:hypothetical protein